MNSKFLLALSCIAGLAASASAQNAHPVKALKHPVMSVKPSKHVTPPQNDSQALWDQSAFDSGLNATVDQEFPDFASYSTYAVEDFATGEETWNVESVSTYFTQGFGFWNTDILTGTLQVFPKTGPLPQPSDIVPEYQVGIRLIDGGGYWIVNADTSGIAELQGISGEYWIGLTPTAAFGTYGQEFHLNMSGFYRENAAIRNNGGAFGLGTDWTSNTVIGGLENSFKLEGTIGGNECYPDCDGNGSLDLFDFLCFTNDFNAGGDYSDCVADGSHDLFDFLCFVNAFNAGC